MSNQSEHLDVELFDFVNEKCDPAKQQQLASHIASCEECSSSAEIVRAVKQLVSQPGSTPATDQHPDVSELASFFFEEPKSQADSRVARHVALCAGCAEAIALYAAGEHAASEYSSSTERTGDVPARAWGLIEDWEERNATLFKPASEVLSRELLDNLYRGLVTHNYQPSPPGEKSNEASAQAIPVVVMNRSGELRSIEYFVRDFDDTGAQILKHAEGSARFDNRNIHVLVDVGENEPVVATEMIESDRVRVAASPTAEPVRVDYVIVDENEV